MPPLNINDADMSPPDNVPTTSSTGITDMSHTAMIYEAMLCQRRLYELSGTASDSWDTWHSKVELIKAFEDYVEGTIASIQDSATPLDKLLKISGHKILISLQLLLRRPPYRQPRNSVPPWDDFNILEAATNVLEHHLQPLSPELEPWAWKNWVQWHALAVVLTELVMKPGHADFDRAYAVATRSFRYYAKIIADSESGMLWKPIAKLMRRAVFVYGKRSVELAPATAEAMDFIGDQTASVSLDPSILGNEYNLENFSWGISSDEGANSTAYMDLTGKHCNGESAMPWVAWEDFLQDMSLTDAIFQF